MSGQQTGMTSKQIGDFLKKIADKRKKIKIEIDHDGSGNDNFTLTIKHLPVKNEFDIII